MITHEHDFYVNLSIINTICGSLRKVHPQKTFLTDDSCESRNKLNYMYLIQCFICGHMVALSPKTQTFLPNFICIDRVDFKLAA